MPRRYRVADASAGTDTAVTSLPARVVALTPIRDTRRVNGLELAANLLDMAAIMREAVASNGDRVKDVFKAFDTDGSGLLCRKEFTDGVMGLGLPLTPKHILEIDGSRPSQSPHPAHPILPSPALEFLSPTQSSPAG